MSRPTPPTAGAARARGPFGLALPPTRRLALLGALLVVAIGGAWSLAAGADTPDDAEPTSAPGVHVPNATAASALPAATDSAHPAPMGAPAAATAHEVRDAAHASIRDLPPDTVVIEREAFGYGGSGRRDPFRPLIITAALRPLPSELRLVAVAYDAAGTNSVAILRDVTTRAQHRVRVGQLVGRMRVTRIRPKAVVFTVEELGFSRQEELALQDSSGTRQP